MSQTLIDARLLNQVKLVQDDGMALMQLLEHEDMYARRHILRCFGKSARLRMECPTTWWDHLKQTLRRKWPRAFHRLQARVTVVEQETGAVLADIPYEIRANHWVIPYVMEPARWSHNDR